MIKIGLTGNIGSGKSTVAKLFRKSKIPTIDTDRLARWAVHPGSPTSKKLQKIFGTKYFRRSDGVLLRKKLAQLVFKDPKALQKLNSIVHPEVKRLLKCQLNTLNKKKSPIVVIETPLLFETGLQKKYDIICLVESSRKVQIKRLLKKGVSLEEIKDRLAYKIQTHRKNKFVDYIINNSQSVAQTNKQVKRLIFSLSRQH